MTKKIIVVEIDNEIELAYIMKVFKNMGDAAKYLIKNAKSAMVIHKDKDIQNSHPNFVVICENCGSSNVYVENTLGYSPTSGGWGEISLICNDCGNSSDIYEN